MAKLLYRTRGMVAPKGKPRVYFFAHPKDADNFLEEICADIFKTQNCAIWYKEDPEARFGEEIVTDLGQMQLFVLPVTARFLTETGVWTEEFSFAIEHHIPVLPIMQEQGLEELFNKKCGDLQYLDKSRFDATAISYEEKLEKFLSVILIGDELADKIRAAFDAYIFLSYRKKDRGYAQELMRLIHKNEFCRDIAIWYDEFLAPGENFNSAIGEALKKSDLFTLVVTPNLVNEENYVMTTEYPMAKAEGKKIFPAELVSTDKALLNEKYEGIGEVTNAHDERALSQTLLSVVQSLAIRANDHSPEHNFFVGLAYLSGIDVEVDKDRAEALIKGSAEAGLPEAMDRLASIYWYGESGARDFEKALCWYERAVQVKEEAYLAAQGEEKASLAPAYFSALTTLAERYESRNQRAKKRACYIKLIEYAEDLLKTQGDGVLQNERLYRLIALNYQKMGDALLEEDNDEYGAKSMCLKQLELYDRVENGEAFPLIRRTLAASYENTARFVSREQCLQEALEIAKDVVERYGEAEDKRTLISIYLQFAQEEYLLRALALAEELGEELKTVASRRQAIECYLALGEYGKTEKETQTVALEYFALALDASEKLVEQTQSAEDWRLLAACYRGFAWIYHDQYDVERGRAYYEKSIEIEERFFAEENYDSRQKLTEAHYELGRLWRYTGEKEKARACFLRAKEYVEPLKDQNDYTGKEYWLKIDYQLFRLDHPTEKYEQPKDVTLLECKLCSFTTDQHVRIRLDTISDLAVRVKTELRLFEVERLRDLYEESIKKEDWSSAKESALELLQLREKIAVETRIPYVYHDLAETHTSLACLEEDVALAREHLEKAKEIWNELLKDPSTTDSFYDSLFFDGLEEVENLLKNLGDK